MTSSISKNIDVDGSRWHVPSKAITGAEYLAQWKNDGGHDQVDVPMNKYKAAESTNMPEVYEEPAKKS